ncbi:MAG: glycosyltransferase [Chitinivibrionales bacterium]|nr:glycosyltransferase [Chitinivibrionales bacterium]
MRISIIIPIYNEEKSIARLIEMTIRAICNISHDYEIIIINDGSTDHTQQELNKIMHAYSKISYIALRKNFGQTAAIMAGIDNASGDIIITMDGDLQNDPEDIPKLLQKLNEGYDVSSGWRQKRKDNFVTRVVPSKIANFLISIVSGVKLHDYGCSLKAYKKEILKDVKLYGEMHRFIPIFAKWQGARVAEVPVTHHPRRYGKSHYGLLRTLKVILDLLVVKFLTSYSQKPIYIFGGFGLINFALSFFGFGLMLYFKFLGNKSFIETPLPQIVVLFFLMGFMSILMGFVAEIQMRTYYESQSKATYVISKTENLNNADTIEQKQL